MQKLVLAADAGAFGCTLSLGLSTFPSDGTDERLLLQRVDSLGPLWANAKLESLRMADVLQAR